MNRVEIKTEAKEILTSNLFIFSMLTIIIIGLGVVGEFFPSIIMSILIAITTAAVSIIIVNFGLIGEGKSKLNMNMINSTDVLKATLKQLLAQLMLILILLVIGIPVIMLLSTIFLGALFMDHTALFNIVIILALLLIVAALLLDAFVVFVPYIAIDHPEMGCFEVIGKAFKLGKDNFLDYIVLELSFILWYISIPLTFGLSSIWVIPYHTITLAKMYEKIS